MSPSFNGERQTVHGKRREKDPCILSCAGVEAVIHCTQARLEDMRIYLSCREIRMPEHHLNGAEIGPVLEQVRRERMAQHVRAQRARETRLAAVSLENL